jgi:hypothetical protein
LLYTYQRGYLNFQFVENRGCCTHIKRGYLNFQFVENRGCLPIKKGGGGSLIFLTTVSYEPEERG